MMIDYFELYTTCLKVIAGKHPEQTLDFINLMRDEPVIKSELAKGTDNRQLVEATYQVLDNLIAEGLVNASKTVTKNPDPIYTFKGLSTIGYYYLKSLEDPTFSDKLKSSLKEEGIPLTPTAISKFIAKLTL